MLCGLLTEQARLGASFLHILLRISLIYAEVRLDLKVQTSEE